MPRLQPLPSDDEIIRALLQRGLQTWAALGFAALLLLPASAWNNHYFGWLPYWLLAAPLLSLFLLHRQRIAAALSAFLVRGRRRRKPFARRQARLRKGAASRRVRRTVRAPGALIEG